MGETFSIEHTLETTRNKLLFSQDKSIFSNDSQEDLSQYDSDFNLYIPKKNDEPFSEEIEEDNRNRCFENINENRKTELEIKNKTTNKSNSLFGSSKSAPIFKTSKVISKGSG